MGINIIRHVRPAADRAWSIAARAWRWMNAPLYQLPPLPEDRGFGWRGVDGEIRPFPLKPTPADGGAGIKNRHENINGGAYK